MTHPPAQPIRQLAVDPASPSLWRQNVGPVIRPSHRHPPAGGAVAVSRRQSLRTQPSHKAMAGQQGYGLRSKAMADAVVSKRLSVVSSQWSVVSCQLSVANYGPA